MRNVLIITILILGFSMTSCLKQKAIEPVEIVQTDTTTFPCGDTVFFSSEILGEIINSNCAGCHTNGGVQGGYSFDSYNEIANASTQILGTIKHEYQPMPQGGSQLNDSLITKFDCWIQQGKLNN